VGQLASFALCRLGAREFVTARADGWGSI